jgi:hypothetical protein
MGKFEKIREIHFEVFSQDKKNLENVFKNIYSREKMKIWGVEKKTRRVGTEKILRYFVGKINRSGTQRLDHENFFSPKKRDSFHVKTIRQKNWRLFM